MLVFGKTARYDHDRDIVTFRATEDSRLVPMGVSRAALLELVNLPEPGPEMLISIYREFELDIQRIAEKKHALGDLEFDGLILVKVEDLA